MGIHDKFNELNLSNMEEFYNLISNVEKEKFYNYTETDSFAAKSAIAISQWGERKLEIGGFEGSISLVGIMQKINFAIEANPKSNPLTNRVRLSGIKLTEKIHSLYLKSETMMDKLDEFAELHNFFAKRGNAFRANDELYSFRADDIADRKFAELNSKVSSYFQRFEKDEFDKYFECDWKIMNPSQDPVEVHPKLIKRLVRLEEWASKGKRNRIIDGDNYPPRFGTKPEHWRINGNPYHFSPTFYKKCLTEGQDRFYKAKLYAKSST